MIEKDLLVELKNIVKIYGEHTVLKNVDFDLRAGEIHCLVGENGAGKSTLIKILSGAVSPESGEIFILGKKVKTLTPRLAIELGITTVYQDAEIVDSLTIAENIFLGNELNSKVPFKIDRQKQVQETQKILEKLGINLDANEIAGNLSTAEKQMVQIAKALHRKAGVIIMDEPTSSLGLEETKALLSLLKSLKSEGLGIIYISHYLNEVFEIADRVTILKDGEKMGTYPLEQIDLNTVVKKMVGRDTALFFQRRRVPIGDVRLRVRDLSKEGVVEDINFDVRAGEIFGIGGLVGSGRTELVSLIYGAERPDKGEIFIDGEKVVLKSPTDAMKKGICFVSEDRKRYGMFLGRNVVENLVSVKNKLSRRFLLNLNEELRLSTQTVKRLSIVVSDRDQLIEELSGGNQQKVIIGRWLLNSNATLYIFDEPTKGVDIGAREQIYQIMLELAENGKSIIMVSSDMPELLSMSDRIGVMRNGRLTHILENKNLKEEDLMRLFIGV
ncbi:sugar ABC transporter ATP-binding protein [Thermotoga profunda]|uniref:sugar ABC transporter ATP-binding protein n=1 Tax=Thermotoga profunda TaxID=1508420 RepID=UPI0005977E9A|nr:sugar ABC transporter ATP-binding protein [Thermotoga profunda]